MIKLYKIENSDLDYKAFICLDSLKNKMAFGGCRFSLSVDENEVGQLAACMSLKLALHGLPVGGAKGGFHVDPKNQRIFEIIADFAKQMRPILSETIVLGKDLGANDDMMDHLYKSMNSPQLSPVQMNFPNKGVPDRIREFKGYQKNMTGKGVAWSAFSFYRDDISKKSAIIQGAGAVGVGTAIRLKEMGTKILAISDKDNAVFCKTGLPEKFFSEGIQGGVIQVSKIPGNCEIMPSQALYSVKADMIALAAASNSIHDHHASNFNVELVVEGSNFGLIDSARQLLFKRKIVVIPDVIASSSSAALVAHQMCSGNSLSEEDVWKKIKNAIIDTSTETLKIAKIENIEPRQAYKDILVPRLLK